jgi:hypothetical protein
VRPLEMAEKLVCIRTVDRPPDERHEVWLCLMSGKPLRYLTETTDRRAAEGLRKTYVDDVALLLELGALAHRGGELEVLTP